MSELPANWTAATLSDITDVIRGVTFPATAKESLLTQTNVCCLRTSNIQRKIEWDDVYFIPRNYVKREDQLVQPGDILMSMANSYELVGKVAAANAVPYPTAFGAFLAAIRPTSIVGGKYLFHLLRTNQVQSELREGSSQTTNIANISISKLASIDIPLAPINEQKRIADKLDAVLARVEACRDRLDRIPAILKRFRQSVLAAATSGKLTEDWRVARGSNSNDWSETTVGELIDRVEAGLNVKCEERPPETGEIGLVKISAVTWGTFDEHESKTLPRGTVLPDFARIRVGDFLISRANTLELVGACVIVQEVTRALYLSDKVLRLVIGDRMKPWLLIVLRSNIGRQQIETLASGNQLSMRNLSQANLKSIRIPIPSEDEQTEIVRRVEALFAYADRLEARHAAVRARVEKLTPATLAKAFRGELVPQDPNDEPANELLERIKAQRSGRAEHKPKRSRRVTA